MVEKTVTTSVAADKEDRVYVGAYITREAHGKLIKIGKSRELKMSDVVREAVREYLAKYETAEA